MEERIVNVPGVESATVNYAAGNATVRYDETRLDVADWGASWRNVSQMTPSISCWIPNSSGIIAKGRSVLASVRLSVATPTADNDVPAIKLAEAEKHIGPRSFRCAD